MADTDKKKTGSFFGGVMLLSLSTVAVKVIGLLYKIPMMARLGAEGMGYFDAAYEVFALLCVIATAGLPVALSMRLAAAWEMGDAWQIRQSERNAMRLFLLLGSAGSLLLFLGAEPIAAMLESRGAALCLRAISPALLFVCLSSGFRGYFQGFSRMAPTAISQLIEAVGKLIFGMLFASAALRGGASLPAVAAAAVLGLTLGTALSALYLLGERCFRGQRGVPIENKRISHKGDRHTGLLRIALPITLSAAVLSITRLLDTVLILHRLQDVGHSEAYANAVYGAYATMALPLFSLVPSLLTPISLALVPRLSGAIARGNREEQATLAWISIRMTVLIALPAAMGLSIYAVPILHVLFAEESDAIAIAAPLLSALGGSVLFSCLITTTNAVLQSYGKTGKPIVSMAVGAVIKSISAYVLIGIEGVGEMGAPISTMLCNLSITAMNLAFLSQCVSRQEKVSKCFVLPLLASASAVGVSVAVYFTMLHHLLPSQSLCFFVAMLLAVMLYPLFALAVRAVTVEDLQMLPFLAGKIQAWKQKREKRRRC